MKLLVNSENQILWMVVDGGDFVLGYAMEVIKCVT